MSRSSSASVAEIGLDRVVLAVHDTGGLIGLRWACDHPDAVGGLVITNTGFFPGHDWIEIAQTMRTPIQGEALVDSLSREGFATLLEEASDCVRRARAGRVLEVVLHRGEPPRHARALSLVRPRRGAQALPGKTRRTRRAHADPLGPAGRVHPASTTPPGSRGRFPAPSSCGSRACAISCSMTSPSAAPRRSSGFFRKPGSDRRMPPTARGRAREPRRRRAARWPPGGPPNGRDAAGRPP